MFTEKEFEALQKEWGYTRRQDLNEFIAEKFGHRFVHGFHETVTNFFYDLTIEIEGIPPVQTKYIRATENRNEENECKVGITEFYFPSQSMDLDKAFAFSIRFKVFYHRGIESAILVMEVFLPETNAWYEFPIPINLATMIDFDKEGLLIKKLYPVLLYDPRYLEKYFRNKVWPFVDALATILYGKLGQYNVTDAINFMVSKDEDFWKPNVVGDILTSNLLNKELKK